MKQIFIFISVIALFQLSCTKHDNCGPAPTSFEGKWRMIKVTDNISGFAFIKPDSIPGDVAIIFTASSTTEGTFIGNTPTNDIWVTTYFIGQNQELSIPALNITKVMETAWGKEFVDNICSAQGYYFENCEKLNIRTTKNTLCFQKQ
ncbi:MAG: hypothetical protein IPI98_01060 [Chitinophagaceae bacterium]|nr:hypothetical protein [Chitinophagaceae bacterium]